MDLRDLVTALLASDALTARQWVADATRADIRWMKVPRPGGLDPVGMAVAAGIVETLAERAGQEAAPWTREVPAAPETVFLVRAARTMPRLRRMCEEEGPEPLRRRRLLAPPDFLTAA
jgi:hypothetical protein